MGSQARAALRFHAQWCIGEGQSRFCPRYHCLHLHIIGQRVPQTVKMVNHTLWIFCLLPHVSFTSRAFLTPWTPAHFILLAKSCGAIILELLWPRSIVNPIYRLFKRLICSQVLDWKPTVCSLLPYTQPCVDHARNQYTQFMLDCRPFYVAGFNAHDLVPKALATPSDHKTVGVPFLICAWKAKDYQIN